MYYVNFYKEKNEGVYEYSHTQYAPSKVVYEQVKHCTMFHEVPTSGAVTETEHFDGCIPTSDGFNKNIKPMVAVAFDDGKDSEEVIYTSFMRVSEFIQYCVLGSRYPNSIGGSVLNHWDEPEDSKIGWVKKTVYKFENRYRSEFSVDGECIISSMYRDDEIIDDIDYENCLVNKSIDRWMFDKEFNVSVSMKENAEDL